MAKHHRVGSILLGSMLAALLVSAAFAGAASAKPTWKFEGEELTGSETITGLAVKSRFSIPEFTITCKTMTYGMTIFNSAGVGNGSLTNLALNNCSTSDQHCTVDSAAAEKLPWPAHLSTVSANNYVVFEGVKISLLFDGPECVLEGILLTITGSAGARYDNPTEIFSLDAASFSATKTALKGFGSAIEWTGDFTTEATGGHAGQALEI